MTSNKYASQSLERAFDVLDMIAAQPSSVSDLSAELGSSRSTTYKTVASLEARGYVFRDPNNGKYFLGGKILHLGDRCNEQNPIIRMARPFLESLVENTQETAHLCAVESAKVVCLDRLDSPQGIKLTFTIGRTSALHASAAAKVLLAYCESDFIEDVLNNPLKQYTANTITESDFLREDLQLTRERGYAFSDGEVTAGARSVSAPIRNSFGDVVASLGISGPSSRFPDEIIAEYAEMVMEAAAQISAKLMKGSERKR